ncbi:MAG: glycosyltransferase family 2 protein [Candidatus Krumholzibacteriota bacterium]|nr:glycosyltransferase family 2 protein [Candidatus Krumholzibacteriota bacterium]
MSIYLFWISAAFVIYTYLVYPIIIISLARIKNKPVLTDDNDMGLPSITMIIVAYNEENKIASKLENCKTLDYPQDLFEICVVSDGSTDGTNDILGKDNDIYFIEDAENWGKPHQINKAVEKTVSDIIVFSDVRQTYKEDSLIKLVRNFNDPKVGCVSGELVLSSGKNDSGTNIGLYWKYEKMLRVAESRVDSTLGATGAIYAVRRRLISPIPDDTILDDVAIPAQALKQGYRVIFEPAAIAYDDASSRIGIEFRRKVRTLTGNFQLFANNPWLFNPLKNRIFFQSISHKWFRLLSPYALIVSVTASGSVSQTIYTVLFWIQIAIYFSGSIALMSGRLKKIRLLNFVSLFLSLNTAAVVGLYRYLFFKPDARWKKDTGPGNR